MSKFNRRRLTIEEKKDFLEKYNRGDYTKEQMLFSLPKTKIFQYSIYIWQAIVLYIITFEQEFCLNKYQKLHYQVDKVYLRVQTSIIEIRVQRYSGGPSKCFFELGRRMKFII
ncbi:Hypothetical_protein [Hexamita inflata]|uniref:Hypothetical_protein n=1 Tax=Hexamita inflata TaxID=28002 RepID=A0AA86PQT8_9EUKA|nr:Hypothetical protein HINF_LOCUS27097 [Hexamita inflata]